MKLEVPTSEPCSVVARKSSEVAVNPWTSLFDCDASTPDCRAKSCAAAAADVLLDSVTWMIASFAELPAATADAVFCVFQPDGKSIANAISGCTNVCPLK